MKFRRSSVLFAMVIMICSYGFQGNQYTAIANEVTSYYGVSYQMVTATGGIVDAVCLLTGLPTTFLLQYIGFKPSLMVAASIVSISACLKCLGLCKDYFWIILLSNALLGTIEMFTITLPAAYAEAWFAGKATATVKGLGMMGVGIGCGVAFLQSFYLLHTSSVHAGIMQITFILTGITVSTFFFIALVARDINSSKSVTQEQQSHSVGFLEDVKKLLTDGTYVMLLVAYNVSQCAFATLTSCLSQCLSGLSLDAVGKAGVFLAVGSIAGAVVCSMILDKTKKFKQCAYLFYTQNFLSVVLIAAALEHRAVWLIFLSCAYFAFTGVGGSAVTLDIIVELTYPSREELSVGLASYLSLLPAVLFRQCFSYLIVYVGPLWSLLILALVLLLCIPLLAMVTWDLKRSRANHALVTRREQCFHPEYS